MSPREALVLLNQATQPSLVGRIDRAGYVQIETALAVLEAVVKETELAKGEKPRVDGQA